MKKNTKETNFQYFISRWNTIFSVLGNGFKSGIFVALMTFVIWFLIEIIASLFGYCITASGQECFGGFSDLFILPIIFSVVAIVSSIWSSGKNLITKIQENKEIAIYFGLSNEIRTKYFKQKSLLTLFIERLYLYIFVLIFLFLTTSDLNSLILWFVVIVLASDLETYNKLGKLSDYFNSKTAGKKKKEPTSVGEYIKQFFLVGSLITGILFVIIIFSVIFS